MQVETILHNCIRSSWSTESCFAYCQDKYFFHLMGHHSGSMLMNQKLIMCCVCWHGMDMVVWGAAMHELIKADC